MRAPEARGYFTMCSVYPFFHNYPKVRFPFAPRSSLWVLYFQELRSAKMINILVGSCTRLSWTWKALACSYPSARIRFWLFLGCIPGLDAAPAGHWCLPGWPWCCTPPLMASLLAPCTLLVGPWPLDLHRWAMWRSAGYCLLYFLGYRVSLHSLAWFTFISCQPRLPA